MIPFSSAPSRTEAARSECPSSGTQTLILRAAVRPFAFKNPTQTLSETCSAFWAARTANIAGRERLPGTG